MKYSKQINSPLLAVVTNRGLLVSSNRSETVPTASGSYDVYVRVTSDDNYMAVTTEKVGTYVVPETYELKVFNAQIFLKDGSDVADLKAVPVGTELKAIAYKDTETGVFKCWTGLDLTEEQSTARVVYFTMPDHDVNLMAVFVTPTNKLEVTDAQVTLKDGGAVADLTAVPVGTELVATAPEKDGYNALSGTDKGYCAADSAGYYLRRIGCLYHEL